MTDELYHYGVKGMKWGIRKRIEAAKSVRRARFERNSRFNAIRRQSAQARQKSISELSAEDQKAFKKYNAKKNFTHAALATAGAAYVADILSGGKLRKMVKIGSASVIKAVGNLTANLIDDYKYEKNRRANPVAAADVVVETLKALPAGR